MSRGNKSHSFSSSLKESTNLLVRGQSRDPRLSNKNNAASHLFGTLSTRSRFCSGNSSHLRATPAPQVPTPTLSVTHLIDDIQVQMVLHCICACDAAYHGSAATNRPTQEIPIRRKDRNEGPAEIVCSCRRHYHAAGIKYQPTAR